MTSPLSSRSLSVVDRLLPLVLLLTAEPSDFRASAVTRPPPPPSSPASCRYLVGFLPALSLRTAQSKHFVGAVDYAMRRANAALLGGSSPAGTCRLEYRTHDNQADTLESLRAMTRLYADGAVAFIGPEDTCATEARLAAAWNLPMIAFVSTLSCSGLPRILCSFQGINLTIFWPVISVRKMSLCGYSIPVCRACERSGKRSGAGRKLSKRERSGERV